MAIHFTTSNPSALLTALKAAVNAKQIETWAYDSDGDFTHTPPQWKNEAWLRPSVGTGVLTFNFIARNNVKTSKEVYAVYHGRFIETMLAHFDNMFSNADATALPVTGDRISLTA